MSKIDTEQEEVKIGSVEIHQDRPYEAEMHGKCEEQKAEIKDLKEQLMKTHKLEEVHHTLQLSSSMVYKDRFCLGGENEEGEYITVWFDSHEFLKCVDKEKLKEIKLKLIKTIKEIK
tara:strand:- start:811 stop:1161 length:351 start_codon:yes stop_codon:yes gene_type:complete